MARVHGTDAVGVLRLAPSDDLVWLAEMNLSRSQDPDRPVATCAFPTRRIHQCLSSPTRPGERMPVQRSRA